MFVKLSAINSFRIERYKGFSFKKWDEQNRQMLSSPTWQAGYSKKYMFDVENPGAQANQLELSSGQLGQMLEGTFVNGSANVLGVEFIVKNNGKTGLELRYQIYPKRQDNQPAKQTVVPQQDDEPPMVIPF